MKNKTFLGLIGVLIILVACYFIFGGSFDFSISKDVENKSEKKATSTKYINKDGEEFSVPHGKYEFQVSSADQEGLTFLEGEIDPPDVHLGDIQKFRVVVTSDVGIDSVVANIETDNGTTTVPLEKTGTLSSSELSVPRLTVNDNNVVEVLSDKERQHIAESMEEGYLPTAYAQEGENEVWQGEWEVQDVHDTTYITQFVAIDNNNEEETLTLAWSDKCSIPINGNWSYGSSCSHGSGIDGVVGDATLNSGATLSLSGGNFLITGQLNLNGGSVSLGTGGSFSPGFPSSDFWIIDKDDDGYPPGSDTTGFGHQATAGSVDFGAEDYYQTRASMSGWENDCLDDPDNASGAKELQRISNAQEISPGQTSYFTSQGDNGWDYDCSGSIEQNWTDISSSCTQLNEYEGSSIAKWISDLISRASASSHTTYGWVGSTPGCGESGYYNMSSSECGQTQHVTQSCR